MFSRVDAKRDGLRRILEAGNRGYTEVGLMAAGTFRVCRAHTPCAAASRIIPFVLSWAAAGRGQRSPGKNAAGSFRLRPARTLQGETRYARCRLAG